MRKRDSGRRGSEGGFRTDKDIYDCWIRIPRPWRNSWGRDVEDRSPLFIQGISHSSSQIAVSHAKIYHCHLSKSPGLQDLPCSLFPLSSSLFLLLMTMGGQPLCKRRSMYRLTSAELTVVPKSSISRVTTYHPGFSDSRGKKKTPFLIIKHIFTDLTPLVV